MNIRPTTVRRLAILLGGVLLLVGIGAGLYLRNEHRKAARLASARSAGLAAFKAGDYRTALDELKTYTWRKRDDNEALFAYAVSRSRIETANGSHLIEGIHALSTLLQQDPDNLEASHRLLELYTQVYKNNEVIDLADRVLELHPEDRAALKAKCTALDRMQKHEAALEVSQKLNELDPQDLEQQLATYKVMRSLKRHDAELLARAQQQQREHPDDPRFELLLGWVYGNAGDMTNCLKWLRAAAARPAPDATYVKYMVRVLDQLKLYRESQSLLDRAVAQNNNPLVMRVLVQRLWQSGKLKDVIERLKDLDPASSQADTDLLAYLALAHFESDNRDQASKIVAALAQRTNDSEAVAWAASLAARFGNIEPRAALKEYQAALVRSPDNSVIRFMVGEAYSRMGETELAISAWKRAADLAPSWMMPHLNIARTLAASGRAKDALVEAELAYRAAPDQLIAITTFASIRYKALDDGAPDPAGEAKLLAFVSDIQKRIPGEAETLPVYVNLLARAGKKPEAIAAARTAITNLKQYDQGTILRLLAASRSHQLGLEDELQSTASDAPATTNPSVVLARAADLAASGKPQDGLTLLESGAKRATTQPVQWQLATLQYKELIRQPDLAREWIALADANPDDLAVQNTVLKQAVSARSDREFIARTIDRLKNLTGSEGQTWKLERARWLIGSESSKDAAEAVNILSDIVRTSPTLIEARLLLAQAYETVGNLPAAAKELQAAADHDPTNGPLVMELARVTQLQNKFEDARLYLERAAAIADLPEELRPRIGAMLAAQGDWTRAITVLENAAQQGKTSTSSQLLLADLYRRVARGKDAEAVYTQLLAAKPPTIDAIRAAAEFYGSQQKTQEAEKVLARLPEAKPRPGMSELVTASYNERWGSADLARRQYLSATVAAPTDPATWRYLINFDLRAGKYDQAKQVCDEAAKALPDDATLKRLRVMTTTLAQLAASNAALRPVLAILAAAPDDRGVVDLLAASDATSQPTTNDAMLARLRDAAGRFPRSLPLQTALVQWNLAHQQFDEAATIAARAMQSFPNDAEPARIATTVYRLRGKHDLAAAAAQQWRERSADNPRAADWTLAEIELSRGNPGGTIDVLKSYLPQFKSNPRDNTTGVALLARAYALAGREKDAHDLLQPLLPKDHGWRLIWLRVAGQDVSDTDAAARWIGEVEPMLASDNERLALGESWYRLAVRGASGPTLENAAKAIDPLVAKSQPSADATVLRAMIADRAGDTKTAEINYRRTLQLAPAQPEAMNNLAYLVLQTGGDISEARTLAAKAVELQPSNPSFLDTLARVQLKAGERDAALASFRKALSLQPNSLEALIGLAGALLDAGQRDTAAPLMARIDELLKNKPPISPQLRRELEAVRSTAKTSL